MTKKSKPLFVLKHNVDEPLRNTQQNVIEQPFLDSDNRIKVNLVDSHNIVHTEDLANIVARTFPDIVGQPPEDYSILPAFKDNNPLNCDADNLFWEN